MFEFISSICLSVYYTNRYVMLWPRQEPSRASTPKRTHGRSGRTDGAVLLLTICAPLRMLTSIKDDCPSADVALQTHYNFQQQAPRTAVHYLLPLKRKKVSGSISSKISKESELLGGGRQRDEHSTLQLSKHHLSRCIFYSIISCR